MPARGAAASSLPMQIDQLRERMRDLLPDQSPHTLPGAHGGAHGASLPLRRLLSDVPFTLEIALSAGRLIRALVGRSEQASNLAVPNRARKRRAGIGRWLLRHPFVAAGLALGVGVAAYRLVRGARINLGSRVPTGPARRADAAS